MAFELAVGGVEDVLVEETSEMVVVRCSVEMGVEADIFSIWKIFLLSCICV